MKILQIIEEFKKAQEEYIIADKNLKKELGVFSDYLDFSIQIL